jgi:hypothetical protein
MLRNNCSYGSTRANATREQWTAVVAIQMIRAMAAK